MQSLEGDALLRHVQELADRIGPRPAGHPQEEQARAYIRKTLASMGIDDIEDLSFPTPDTWGYGMIAPTLLALIGYGVAFWNQFVGAIIVLLGTYQLWQIVNACMHEQLLYRLYPMRTGGSVVAHISPQKSVKNRVVLVGHVDSNKHRPTFSPMLKRGLQLSSSLLLVSGLLCSMALFMGWQIVGSLMAVYMAVALLTFIVDELGGYVDGANDNGSAVACVLALAQQVSQTPLNNTELWLAFTGSEEVGHQGLNAVLDKHHSELRDAWFINFEMVGKGDIYFITRHGSLTYLNPYSPDSESLSLARDVATSHPEHQVQGRELVMLDEVATLRRRGFRGICLVGLDRDGWPANWHRRTDIAANIDPMSLQRAATFAWSMLEHVDSL